MQNNPTIHSINAPAVGLLAKINAGMPREVRCWPIFAFLKPKLLRIFYFNRNTGVVLKRLLIGLRVFQNPHHRPGISKTQRTSRKNASPWLFCEIFTTFWTILPHIFREPGWIKNSMGPAKTVISRHLKHIINQIKCYYVAHKAQLFSNSHVSNALTNRQQNPFAKKKHPKHLQKNRLHKQEPLYSATKIKSLRTR